ncbi:hypothetical protein [Clostridium baratii]|uniref:hypothetical protein n=1 Tax=Clostridium baratii TaxID=1561 RepID=UPI0030CB5B05
MKLNESLFKETEERLRNYYKKEKKIKSIKNQIKFLEDKTNMLLSRIENNDFGIPANVNGVNISDRVQTSVVGSPIEQSMIKVLERIEKEIAWNIEEINRLEILIINIEKDYNAIENNIENNFEAEDKKFLEEAYKACEPNWRLANKHHMSEVSCTRKKKKLISQMLEWEKSA